MQVAVADLEGEQDGIAARLCRLDVDVFALDCADIDELAEFARSWAARFGLPCFVTDELLSHI